MADLEKKIVIPVELDSKNADKTIDKLKKDTENKGVTVPINVDLKGIEGALKGIEKFVIQMTKAFDKIDGKDKDFKFSGLQKGLDDVLNKLEKVTKYGNKGTDKEVQMFKVDVNGFKKLTEVTETIQKNIEALNDSKIDVTSFDKLEKVLKNIETIMDSIKTGLNFETIRPSAMVQNDIEKVTNQLDGLAKKEAEIIKLEQYLNKTGISKGKSIIADQDSQDVGLGKLVEKMERYIQLGGDLSKIKFSVSGLDEMYSLIDVFEILEDEGKINLIDESAISNDVDHIKVLREELSKLNDELTNAQIRENRDLNVSLDTKSVEDFSKAIAMAVEKIGELHFDVPEGFTFDGLSVENLEKIIGKLDEIVSTIKNIGTLLTDGVDLSNLNINQNNKDKPNVKVEVTPSVDVDDFIYSVEQQLATSGKKVKVESEIIVNDENPKQDEKIDNNIIDESVLNETIKKLKNEFQLVAKDFGFDLGAAIEAIKDDLEQTVGSIEYEKLFNSLRETLLDIVVQFQKSLDNVSFSKEHTNEIYNLLKQWNEASNALLRSGNKDAERAALLNQSSGAISNGYLYDKEGSFAGQLLDELNRFGIGVSGKIGEIYDTWLHSHPLQKIEQGYKTKGANIGFSAADLEVYKKKYQPSGVANMMVANNGKFTNINWENISSEIIDQVIALFKSSDIFDNGKFVGNKVIENGIYDYDKQSELINAEIIKAMKSAGIQDAESRLTTGNIESLQTDLSVFREEEKKTAQEAEELFSVLNQISEILNGFNQSNAFKFEGLDTLISNLEEVKILLNDISNSLKSGINMLPTIDEVEQKTKNKSVAPQTLYHGSNASFDEFDLSYQNNATYGAGVYLTPDKEFAADYGKNIYECFADINNTFLSNAELSEQEIAKIFEQYNEAIIKLSQSGSTKWGLGNFDISTFDGFTDYVKSNSGMIINVLREIAKYSDKIGSSSDILSSLGYDSYLDEQRQTLCVFDPSKVKIQSNPNQSNTIPNVIENNKDRHEETDKIQVEPQVDPTEFANKVTEQLKGVQAKIDVEPNLFSNEDDKFQELKNKLQEVIKEIENKTNAFITEQNTVEQVVDSEKLKLDELSKKVHEVTKEILLVSASNENPEKIQDLNLGQLNQIGHMSDDAIGGINLFAQAIDTLKEALNGLGTDGQQFLSMLNELSSKTEGLKTLATVLKSSAEQIEQAKAAITGSQPKIAEGATTISDDPKKAIQNRGKNATKAKPVLSQAELEQRSTEIQTYTENLIDELEEQGIIIKNLTYFYDSHNNKVKSQFKAQANGDGSVQNRVYTVNYGEEEAFSSHIDVDNFEKYDQMVTQSYEKEKSILQQIYDLRIKTMNPESKDYADNKSKLLLLGQELKTIRDIRDEQGYKDDEAANAIAIERQRLKDLYKERKKANDKSLLDKNLDEQVASQNKIYELEQKIATSKKETSKAGWSVDLESERQHLLNLQQEAEQYEKLLSLEERKAYVEKETQKARKKKEDVVSAFEKEEQDKETNKKKDTKKQRTAEEIDAESAKVSELNALYDKRIALLVQIRDLSSKKDKTADEETTLVELNTKNKNLIEEINSALHGQYERTTKVVNAATKLRKTLSDNFELPKQVSTYDPVKIKSQISQTQSEMDTLKVAGQTTAYKALYEELYADVKKYNQELTDGSLTLSEYNTKIKEIKKQLRDNKNVVKFIDPEDIQNATIEMKDYAEELSNEKAKLISSTQLGDKATYQWIDEETGMVHELTLSYNSLNGALSQTHKLHQQTSRFSFSLSEILKQGWTNILRYVSSFMGFYEVINAVRRGITVIRELDTALTEMRKVSDETVESLERFQKASFDIAHSVGTTAQQIQNSTADFMRLGEPLKDAAESAKVANILFNVSEFENIDEATESLVSMAAAYKELDKIDIVDKLNIVGNNFAISTDGLAVALQNSASALTTAGNDMDEAVALATAANSVVQDADKVGAGLRTIALRITGTEAAKKELEELGESVDDFTVTTTSKLNEKVMMLTKTTKQAGVSLLDMNGNYRSTYEIISDIADRWEEIKAEDLATGENRQNALLEMLAGEQFCLRFVETHIYRTHLIARIA